MRNGPPVKKVGELNDNARGRRALTSRNVIKFRRASYPDLLARIDPQRRQVRLRRHLDRWSGQGTDCRHSE